jgi:hypothetical protein
VALTFVESADGANALVSTDDTTLALGPSKRNRQFALAVVFGCTTLTPTNRSSSEPIGQVPYEVYPLLNFRSSAAAWHRPGPKFLTLPTTSCLAPEPAYSGRWLGNLRRW